VCEDDVLYRVVEHIEAKYVDDPEESTKGQLFIDQIPKDRPLLRGKLLDQYAHHPEKQQQA
jgi:hypothetical protein